MHLTAIRLAGFKSFADNTTFPVDAPLTGIIGPNGCGKSNIIDAVRWVLGETAAKQLRGQAMTDVIFAGAANRRGAAQASVALHFDNSDGKAGGAFADYAELVIARKVQSDGQSQYSINGKRVRRRDIVELLQGTGVGARSYAVIEQGMISRIIEAKPEELRVFIEEAAGISQGAANRNYPDDNHKPESMIALGDFWLLHGFAPLNTIEERLASRPSLATIAHLIHARGLKEAYTHIMQIPRSTVTTWLKPLLDAPAPKTPCDNPDYWLHETMRLMRIDPLHPDHGLLSFYLMNIVHMQNGEGIFQRARLPHAYLRGQNIELMAASNNVLRAGLTPKHIDLAELLRIVDTDPVHPAIIPPPAGSAPYTYPAPVDDYTLATTHLPQGEQLLLQSSEATIVLNLEDKLRLREGEQTLELQSGEAAFLTPNSRCELAAHGQAYVVIASNH